MCHEYPRRPSFRVWINCQKVETEMTFTVECRGVVGKVLKSKRIVVLSTSEAHELDDALDVLEIHRVCAFSLGLGRDSSGRHLCFGSLRLSLTKNHVLSRPASDWTLHHGAHYVPRLQRLHNFIDDISNADHWVLQAVMVFPVEYLDENAVNCQLSSNATLSTLSQIDGIQNWMYLLKVKLSLRGAFLFFGCLRQSVARCDTLHTLSHCVNIRRYNYGPPDGLPVI